MRKIYVVLATIALSLALLVTPTGTANAASSFDRIFYNAGTQTIAAKALNTNRLFFVPPGHKSSEYAQSTGWIPANTYSGVAACYHAWRASGGDEGGTYNVYARSLTVAEGGPNNITYITAYGKKTCP